MLRSHLSLSLKDSMVIARFATSESPQVTSDEIRVYTQTNRSFLIKIPSRYDSSFVASTILPLPHMFHMLCTSSPVRKPSSKPRPAAQMTTPSSLPLPRYLSLSHLRAFPATRLSPAHTLIPFQPRQRTDDRRSSHASPLHDSRRHTRRSVSRLEALV